MLDQIGEEYFREIDTAALEDSSVRGILQSLKRRHDDRFSNYFGPKAYRHFRETTQGSFSGVGLSVVGVKQGLRVATVFDRSPAKKAGIEAGDLIVAVDGASIAGRSAELSTELIKGEPGTTVTLRVKPGSGGAARVLEVERATVALPVVDGRLVTVAGSKVAYVRLLSFTEGVHAQLRGEIDDLRQRGATGLILDLRGNGGGLLSEAVLTASVFVENGTIVTTSGRTQRDRTYDAAGDALSEQPTVVLVNGDTASAAEILASAVRDADLATLVGERTFGKGVFQEVIPLGNGGALSLTVGEYLARDGESLGGTGIKPDVIAADDLGTQADEVLRRGRAVLAPKLED